MSSTPSVVIPAWNGEDHIVDCLSALSRQSHQPMQILVVENGSTDGTCELIKTQFPDVALIENESNLGFSVASNMGIDASTGGPIVLLNQDTIVDDDWLARILEVLEYDPEIGIVGSLTRYPNGKIQHAGGYLDCQGNGHHKKRKPKSGLPVDVEYVTGAALAVSRKALATIGLLDEAFYPAYFEDVDLCLRARKAGFRVVISPTATVVHKEESRMTEHSFMGNYYFQKNRLRLVVKHWPLNDLTEKFLPAEIAWLEAVAEGGEILVSAVHHAYFDTILNLPAITKWRSDVYNYNTSEQAHIINCLLRLRGIMPLSPASMPDVTGRVAVCSL